ncbi:hypothetical protein BC351_18440 [Paenibacillus ferrarius]|uniref:Uncharacterized protein n=1 Tax=Paenibacillus ferrarius TaxID=1469647 RepID=A0A1V4HJB0_9BACL|nr:hypothetical protein BC351_29170 [Paenibacillus ferrarius]OPH60468.1 hypothetical protein BC351_18440 [Paenibacillus ferrarius]
MTRAFTGSTCTQVERVRTFAQIGTRSRTGCAIIVGFPPKANARNEDAACSLFLQKFLIEATSRNRLRYVCGLSLKANARNEDAVLFVASPKKHLPVLLSCVGGTGKGFCP